MKKILIILSLFNVNLLFCLAAKASATAGVTSSSIELVPLKSKLYARKVDNEIFFYDYFRDHFQEILEATDEYAPDEHVPEELAELICEYACIEQEPWYESIKNLTKASELNDIKRVKEILESDVGKYIVNGKSKHWTALHWAACKDNVEIGEFLLKNSADTEATDYFNCTPLMVAITFKSIKMIKLLISNNANINVRTQRGETILMQAIQANDKATVEFLLTKDEVDVNAKSNNGQTALMLAVIYDSPDIVELLLRKQANVYATDDIGRTALMWAESFAYHPNYERVTKLLKDRERFYKSAT